MVCCFHLEGFPVLGGAYAAPPSSPYESKGQNVVVLDERRGYDIIFTGLYLDCLHKNNYYI